MKSKPTALQAPFMMTLVSRTFLRASVGVELRFKCVRTKAANHFYLFSASNVATTGRWSEPMPQFGILGM